MASIDTKRELLKGVSLFASISPKELDEVERLADTVELPAGKVLMRQGEHGTEMFVLASGSVKVERNGREIARLGPGEVVGEMSLLSEGPRLATVTTLEPTTAIVIGHREFHTLIADSADLRKCIFDNVVKRIAQVDASGTL
ncbi:MAG TPA: cyclic nucleotide-binding domain-containing protein [Candidatus Binatia bacterium]|nr:cyclic nucleotide-binding domain-containing protein [Candidatus Binatia bacterium]